MPAAELQLTRSGAYLVVAWVPVPEYAAGGTAPVPLAPRLPEGLYAFTTPDMVRRPYCVSMRLSKDASGVDCTPALVSADYLRECGWDVTLPEWCR